MGAEGGSRREDLVLPIRLEMTIPWPPDPALGRRDAEPE